MVQAYLYLHHACLAYLRGVALDDPIAADSDRTWSDALVHAIRNDNLVTPVQEDLALQPARAEMLFMALQELVQIMTLTRKRPANPS